MKLTVKAKDFLAELKIVQRATKANNVTLKIENNTLYFLATSSFSSIELKSTSCDVEGKNGLSTTLDLASLESVIKNRLNLILELKNNELHFSDVKAKSYKGVITVLEKEKIKLENTDGVLIDNKVVQKLYSLVTKIAINHVSDKKEAMLPFIVEIGKDYIECASATRTHLAHSLINMKTKVGEKIEVLLSADSFLMLHSIMKQEKYKLSISDKALFAESENIKLHIATQQITYPITLKQVRTLLPTDNKKCVVETEQLKTKLDNMLSICGQAGLIKLQVGDNEIKLSAESTRGSMKDSIAFKGKLKEDNTVTLAPLVLENLISQFSAGNLSLEFVENKQLKFQYTLDEATFSYVQVAIL